MKSRGMSFAAFALALPMICGETEASPCDPNLLALAANPYGYRLRGERCEGLYILPVSGAPLIIASWTASLSNLDLVATRALTIEWLAPPGTGAIHLRAQALRRRLYYRMDSVRPPGSNSFVWPTDILAAIGVARREVAITGQAMVTVEGADRELLLPLRIVQDGKAAENDGYRLILLPSVELAEIYLNLAGAGTVLRRDEPLGYGYYPAERPVGISVAAPPTPGIYHLEIGATLRSGGAAAADLWFYHPGR